ncbi:unnamed protein product [Lymnaea stagnalis]|uniref:Uncharacterized protein n=1 Tax=Lymnaea stagnalis TaxID=6523 RepID=A0AAV2ISK7_LYMST
MKDKRQRMALAWPYGIADPHLYAYLAAAAASYPYGMQPPHSGLGCYPTTGVSLGQAPQNFPPTPPHLQMSPAVRPSPITPSDFLGNLTNTYMRQNGIGAFSLGTSHPSFPGSTSQLLRSPLDQTTMSILAAQASSALNSQHLTSPHFMTSLDNARLAAAVSAASNHSAQFTHSNTVSPSQHSSFPGHVRRTSPTLLAPVPKKAIAAPTSSTAPKGLFRPFQTDGDRS